MRRPPLVALAAAVAATVGLAVAPAEAKSISTFGIPCSNGTAIRGEFMSQGSRYTLGFQTTVGGQWRMQILDNGVPTLDHLLSVTDGVPTGLTTFRTLTKGAHVLTYQAELIGAGVSCTSTLSTRV